jgi:hypothetical protein
MSTVPRHLFGRLLALAAIVVTLFAGEASPTDAADLPPTAQADLGEPIEEDLPATLVTGSAGTTVNLTGGNFGASPSVSFDAGAALPSCGKTLKVGCVSKASATALTIKAPAQGSGPSLQTIHVTTGGVAADTPFGPAQFAYGPIITKAAVTAGKAGSTVKLTGANLSSSAAVTFAGGTALPKCSKTLTQGCVLSSSATSISVKAPAQGGGSGVQTIAVTVNGAAADTPYGSPMFAYDPVITRVSPAFGGAGSTVTISGGNFGKGMPSVSSGGGTALPACGSLSEGCVKAHSDKSITVRAPAQGNGAALQTIAVTVNGVTAAAPLTPAVFDYGAIITKLSPAYGKAGTVIRVGGGNLNTGTAAVTFNGATLPACSKSVKVGCVKSAGAGAITISAPAQGGGPSLQTIAVAVNGVAADTPFGTPVFDFGPIITKANALEQPTPTPTATSNAATTPTPTPATGTPTPTFTPGTGTPTPTPAAGTSTPTATPTGTPASATSSPHRDGHPDAHVDTAANDDHHPNAHVHTVANGDVHPDGHGYAQRHRCTRLDTTIAQLGSVSTGERQHGVLLGNGVGRAVRRHRFQRHVPERHLDLGRHDLDQAGAYEQPLSARLPGHVVPCGRRPGGAVRRRGHECELPQRHLELGWHKLAAALAVKPSLRPLRGWDG